MLRYVAIGGGATPESTEVSLEQNLALLQRVLPGPGVLLFAGGPGSASVRVLDERTPPDPLLVRLGDLFQPRPARHSRYRASRLDAGPASLADVERALGAALGRGDEPLLVFVAAHGEQGEHARDNSVVLWGGGRLSAARLAELHDARPRPLRVVSASCFSGGFSELAFAQALEELGPARAPRCGLFAGTWDRETSGCDPDPDRRNQESYALHFLHALERRDRDGEPLSQDAIDFDGDGGVSLLEAHTRAAIAARSIDVPTTTSERYLRTVQAKTVSNARFALAEQRALLAQLGARLDVPTEADAHARHAELTAQIAELEARFDGAQLRGDAVYGELAARLLGRFPALDDAYHPDFAATLRRDRLAITAALDGWPEARRNAEAEREVARIEAQLQALDVQEAQLTRLLRAYETQALASALHERNGPELAHYQKLLACERYAPSR